MNATNNVLLIGTSRTGDFVLNSQPLAKEQSFRNVAKTWYEKTRPIKDVVEEAEKFEQSAETLRRRPMQFTPAIGSNGRFVLRDEVSDRMLEPTQHVIQQLCKILGIGATYPTTLFGAGRADDTELLGRVFSHHVRRCNGKDRTFNFRVRDGHRITGIIPEMSIVIDNSRYLRHLSRLIPDGRISHWRGGEDSILGNLLIPDTIRQEDDSEYGAMLSVSNSEVLEHRFCQRPSLFRAICMNGCIWGQERGNALTIAQFGRSAFSMNEFSIAIENNLLEQIPLCIEQVDRLFATRNLSTRVSMKPIIAQVAKDHRLSKAQASAVLTAWHVEAIVAPGLAPTLFGLINGITRAAQQMDIIGWRQLDELGGQLVAFHTDRWEALVTRASKMRDKEVQTVFEKWSMATAV